MYDDLFDSNNDGQLDAGEMSNYMDFQDYMNHDGIYKESSDYGGSDEYDESFDSGDDLGNKMDEGSFYSGSYGGQNMNISSKFVNIEKPMPPEYYEERQNEYYKGLGNECLKRSIWYFVISSLLLGYCIWIRWFTYHRGLFFDLVAIFFIITVILNICFWVSFWKGIFYRKYKRETEAYIYVATPISSLSVLALFFILLFFIAE